MENRVNLPLFLFLVVFICCQIFVISVPRYGLIKGEKADILSNKLSVSVRRVQTFEWPRSHCYFL